MRSVSDITSLSGPNSLDIFTSAAIFLQPRFYIKSMERVLSGTIKSVIGSKLVMIIVRFREGVGDLKEAPLPAHPYPLLM